MKGHVNTNIGEVTINKDVIAKYAGMAAVECSGIVGMASINMREGIVRLLKKDSIGYGVTVELENNKVVIDLHIVVSYGVNISAVADNLINIVKYNVEDFSGLDVKKINVYVEGVRVID